MKTKNSFTVCLLIFFFLFIFRNSFAQNQYLGLELGTNITNVNGGNFHSETLNRYGAAVGAFYEVESTRKYFLELGVLYEQKGFKNRIQITNETGVEVGYVDIKYNFDYISFPLKVGRKFGDKFKLNPFVGISSSIIFSAKEKLDDFHDSNILFGGDGYEVELAEPFSYLNLSGLLGTSLEFELSKNIALKTSVVFQHSINKLGNKVLFNRSNLRHVGLLTTVGVKYLIEKEEE